MSPIPGDAIRLHTGRGWFQVATVDHVKLLADSLLELEFQLLEVKRANRCLKALVSDIRLQDENDRDGLEQRIMQLGWCDCGRELSPGTCGVCDNDD